MSKQLKMLNHLISYIVTHENKTQEEAFDYVLRFIANQLDFEDLVATPWVKQETFRFIQQNLNLDVLREDKWDWLGELHHQLKLNLIKGDYYVKRDIIEKMTGEIVDSLYRSKTFEYQMPISYIDECVATGRNILAFSNHLPKETVVYGVEWDKIAYQIAVVNMKLYGIFSVILHANHKVHDIRPNSPNWRYANLFEGIKQSRLLTEAEVDEYR